MALSRIAEAYVQVVPRIDGVAGQIKGQLSGELAAAGAVGGDAMAKGTASGFGSKVKGYFAPIAATVATTFAAVGISNFVRESVTASSSFAESANAVNVAFGKSAPQIAKLGEDAATRLGLSARAFNEIATRFSGFAGTIAGPSGDIAGVIDQLSTRGADFASVFNIDVNEALTLFQSGLAGETEPLRRYGIDLSAATVEAFAYSEGIAKSGEKLTEQQKVQARYALLLQSTSKVQGDFANTSDGLANQQRILAAQLEESQRKLGDQLLPAFLAITSFANDSLIPAFNATVDAIAAFAGWIDENKVVVATFIGVATGLLIFFNRATIAIKLMAAAQAILNAVMATNPLTLVAIAIAALVAGIVYLATKTTFFQDLWKNFTAFVTTAWDNVVKFFRETGENISKFFGNVWDKITGFVRAALNTIVQLFLDWTVLGWIIKNWGNIVSFFSNAWNNIIGFFRDALSNIATAVSNGIGNVIRFFRELPGKIVSALGNLGGSLVQLGKDMINGLLSGAGSILPQIGTFFLDMLPGWIVGPFKKALGIASPSKVFKEFGKNIGDGLVGGLMGGEGSVRATMDKVKSWVKDKLESGELTQAGANAARKLVKTYGQELGKLEKEFDQISERLKKKQEELADKIQEQVDYVAGLSGQFGAGTAVGIQQADPAALASASKRLTDAQADYNKAVAENGVASDEAAKAKERLTEAEAALAAAQSTTATSAIAQLQARIASTETLKGLTGQLIDLGLNDGLLKQIVEAGAVDFAQSIIDGGTAAVGELNVLATEADAKALALAEQVGATLFDEGIKFAQGTVDELKKKKVEIAATMKEVAKDFGKDLSAAIRVAVREVKDATAAAETATAAANTAAGKLDGLKTQRDMILAGLPNGGKPTKFAKGGFVTGPTRALIGEAGPEVVYPLRDFERVMGIGDKSGKTLIYNAAPNASLDSERALFQAIKRAEVIAGW